MRLALAATLLVACSGTSGDNTLEIDTITPNFGPISGGTRVVINGRGFLRDGAPPNRVVIGSTEAPLAAAASDSVLEVEIPPGDMPGDVPVVVFNRNGTVTAMGKFHYSTPPAITSLTPKNVLYSAPSSTITVTGSGFKDENAGVVSVFVNGEQAVDVNVLSDTQLTFTAQSGRALSQPDVRIVNTRGEVEKEAAFRYVPSNTAGLILFTRNNPTVFALFVDPANPTTTVQIPQGPNPSGAHLRGVYFDPTGVPWALRQDAKFGRLDFAAGTIVDPISTQNQLSTLAFMNNKVYTYSRGNGQFGTFDPETGQFSQVGTTTLFGGCQNLAVKGGTMMYYAQCSPAQIGLMNVDTGVTSAVVPLAGNPRIGEMRFVGNTLYAITGNPGAKNVLITIDPSTGVNATVATYTGFDMTTLEVFTP